MLPEGGPAPHFGTRFSEMVTQKGFKIMGKTNTFADSRYPANPSAPGGAPSALRGTGPPAKRACAKPLQKQRKTMIFQEAPLCCLRRAQRIILGIDSRQR